MDRGPLLDVAQRHRLFAGGLRGVEEREVFVPRGGGAAAECVELLLRVEDPDHLSGLGEAVQVALAEGGSVGGVPHLGEDGIREAVRPSVLVRVGRQVEQLSRLDELAHVASGVVDLHHIRHVVAGECQRHLRLQVVEGLAGALDGDVGVLLLEGGIERHQGVVLAATDLLIPHHQLDVAEGGGVGLCGRRCAAAGGAGRRGLPRSTRGQHRGTGESGTVEKVAAGERTKRHESLLGHRYAGFCHHLRGNDRFPVKSRPRCRPAKGCPC